LDQLYEMAEKRWYQVHVTLFKHTKATESDETFVHENELALSLPNDAIHIGSQPARLLPTNASFNAAPVQDKEYLAAMRSLEISSRYKPIQTWTWLQPFTGKEESPTVVFTTLPKKDQPLPEYQGTFKIYMQRFVHVDINFWQAHYIKADMSQSFWYNPELNAMLKPAEGTGTPELLSSRDNHSAQQQNSSAWQSPDVWQTLNEVPENTTSLAGGLIVEKQQNNPTNNSYIKWSRDETYLLSGHHSMKSNELYYIDHPNFGFLVKFNRYEW
jgi:hypothetical protein